MIKSDIDQVHAFPVGKSRGTAHLLSEAWKLGIKCSVYGDTKREGSDND